MIEVAWLSLRLVSLRSHGSTAKEETTFSTHTRLRRG